jgi:hypothetical protein
MRVVAVICLLVPHCVLGSVGAQDKAPDEFKRVATADLQSLAGTWEMAIEPKTGWKGAVRIRIAVRKDEPKDKSPKDGTLDYDFRLEGDGVKTDNILVETSANPLHFAVLQKGKARYLVVVDDPYAAAKIDPSNEKKVAAFVLDGDRLTLNVAKSHKAFVSWSDGPTAVPLPWAKLAWVRVKEKK